MYNNPVGPVSAAAGLGGGGIAYMGGGMTALYLFMAVFALIGAFWAAMRFLPAGVTERPRAFAERALRPKNSIPGRREVKRYDFSRRR